MEVKGRVRDMRDTILANCRKNRLDAVVCIGGDGTQKNAFRLVEKGINVITLPKTIDNDVAMTDASFGFDTALGIATEAIDRLHSTAHSHHRIIVVEVMGHRAGWLTLSAGIAGGADVILIPEIPYRRESRWRGQSVVAASAARISASWRSPRAHCRANTRLDSSRPRRADRKPEPRRRRRAQLPSWPNLDQQHAGNTLRLAQQSGEV